MASSINCDAKPWQLFFQNYSSLLNDGIVHYNAETDKVQVLKENKSRAEIYQWIH